MFSFFFLFFSLKKEIFATEKNKKIQ